jgi:hypothetical protein
LEAGRQVLVLDDDGFIAKVWAHRIKSEVPKSEDVRLLVFKRFEAFAQHVRKHRADVATCLVDYEFLDDTRSGLDMIQALGIAERAVLVTSHDEEPTVRQRCVDMGVHMVPKTCAPYVPLRVCRPCKSDVRQRAIDRITPA